MKFGKNLLIFPNNLYEVKYLPKNIDKIYILEDPIFFGYRKKQLKFFFFCNSGLIPGSLSSS